MHYLKENFLERNLRTIKSGASVWNIRIVHIVWECAALMCRNIKDRTHKQSRRCRDETANKRKKKKKITQCARPYCEKICGELLRTNVVCIILKGEFLSSSLFSIYIFGWLTFGMTCAEGEGHSHFTSYLFSAPSPMQK